MAARSHEAFLVRLLCSGELAVGQETLLRFLLLSGALIGLLSPGPPLGSPLCLEPVLAQSAPAWSHC